MHRRAYLLSSGGIRTLAILFLGLLQLTSCVPFLSWHGLPIKAGGQDSFLLQLAQRSNPLSGVQLSSLCEFNTSQRLWILPPPPQTEHVVGLPRTSSLFLCDLYGFFLSKIRQDVLRSI